MRTSLCRAEAFARPFTASLVLPLVGTGFLRLRDGLNYSRR